MKIERYKKENASVLFPKGNLIYEGTDELEILFKALIDDIQYVILNLTHTKFLSAKGLGVLACYAKLFREKQGGLKLTHVNENIKKLFNIAGLIKVVEIFEDDNAALASLGPQLGKLEKMLLWSKESLA